MLVTFSCVMHPLKGGFIQMSTVLYICLEVWNIKMIFVPCET